MRLLLDTHSLIWWNEDSPRLPAPFRKAIQARGNDVFVSSASVWEIALKRRTGRLAFRGRMVEAIARLGFEHLSITAAHAEAVEELPLLHRDPFDRLLVAQAQSEGMILLTVDQKMLQYAPLVLPTL